jgi:hypothetical protein
MSVRPDLATYSSSTSVEGIEETTVSAFAPTECSATETFLTVIDYGAANEIKKTCVRAAKKSRR